MVSSGIAFGPCRMDYGTPSTSFSRPDGVPHEPVHPQSVADCTYNNRRARREPSRVFAPPCLHRHHRAGYRTNSRRNGLIKIQHREQLTRLIGGRTTRRIPATRRVRTARIRRPRRSFVTEQVLNNLKPFRFTKMTSFGRVFMKST